MTPTESFLKAALELKAACQEIAASGHVEPNFHVMNVPREVFDEIPVISRVDDGDEDMPQWEKRYQGILYICWQAPMVKL